jgi:hypothetical protein
MRPSTKRKDTPAFETSLDGLAPSSDARGRFEDPPSAGAAVAARFALELELDITRLRKNKYYYLEVTRKHTKFLQKKNE